MTAMPLDVYGIDCGSNESAEPDCIIVPALAREQIQNPLVPARGLKRAEGNCAAKTPDGRAHRRGPVFGDVAWATPHPDAVEGSDAGDSPRCSGICWARCVVDPWLRLQSGICNTSPLSDDNIIIIIISALTDRPPSGADRQGPDRWFICLPGGLNFYMWCAADIY